MTDKTRPGHHSRIFLMPGLGLHPSLFDRLQFPAHDVIPLQWITPRPNEALSDYCRRIIPDAYRTSRGAVLIGHSFGGLVVQELAQWMKPRCIILLSSIKSAKELPRRFRWLRRLHLYRAVSQSRIEKTFPYWGHRHGYPDAPLRSFFMQSVQSLSPIYFPWAVKSLIHWRGGYALPCPILHIHGSRDRTFPIRYIQGARQIEGGDHLLVVHRAAEVQALIDAFLQDLVLD